MAARKDAKSQADKAPTDLGKRILIALEAEGRTQTSVERELHPTFSKGYLSRVIYGSRGTSIDPEKLGALADLLHVDYEWLARGLGAMRRGGRGSTPAEEAIVFARRANTREDAIRLAWERNRDRVDTMTATDWVFAIDAEARRLDRERVPRPEEVAKRQENLRRVSAQRTKQKAAEDSTTRAAAASLDAEIRAFFATHITA